MADCKQWGLSMVAQCGELKTLWDELANYEQILQCMSSGCKCDVVSKIGKRRGGEGPSIPDGA